MKTRTAGAWCVALASAACLGLVAAALEGSGERDSAAGRARPTPLLDQGYAGSEACRGCHASNHASWSASFHRTMTQPAGPSAIRAPFEGRTPTLDGLAWALSRDGARAFATPIAPDGTVRGKRLEVALVTGSHHYQIYWLEDHDAPELAQLPFAWHLGEQAWIPRRSLFLAPPAPETDLELGRWTRTCIKCHTTHGVPRRASDGRAHVAEFGIACEACHGPGREHAELERGRAALPEAERAAPHATRIVDPGALPPARASEVCGQCHGIHPLATPDERAAYEREGPLYRPGDVLAASSPLLRGTRARNDARMLAFLDRNPATLGELFWKDGEVRVSGREYNGLIESACFQRGTLTCLTCHDLHPPDTAPEALARWAPDQLRPGLDGGAACLGCHSAYAAPQARAEHTHHAAGSSGQNCLDCHMPYTTYGLTKAIRSHTITSPRVQDALATGRPDACNLCHLDRSLGWAAERLSEWYGHARPDLDPNQRTLSAAVVWALTGDAGTRAIVAAALAWAPARAVSGTGWMPYVLSTLLQDPYDAVRFVAQRALRLEPRYRSFRLDFTAPLDAQRDVVRASVLEDWTRAGLFAAPAQRAAVLVRPDGTLDEVTFRRLFARVDRGAVRLAE